METEEIVWKYYLLGQHQVPAALSLKSMEFVLKLLTFASEASFLTISLGPLS